MTPLRHSQVGNTPSIFGMHYDITNQLSDNLRNLIQTNHGDRLGRPGFGANLRPLSLEIMGQSNFESEAMSRISNSVGKYLPFVNLKTMTTTRLPEGFQGLKTPAVLIRLEYDVKGLGKMKALEVIINLAG
jgi:phage baseplate assembly protein W